MHHYIYETEISERITLGAISSQHSDQDKAERGKLHLEIMKDITTCLYGVNREGIKGKVMPTAKGMTTWELGSDGKKIVDDIRAYGESRS